MIEEVFDTVIEQDFAVAYFRLLGKLYYKQITVTKLVETAGYGREPRFTAISEVCVTCG